MRNIGQEWIILVLLLIIAALASIIVYQHYGFYGFMEEKKVVLKNLREISLASLLTLTDSIDLLVYVVEHNSTGEDTISIVLKTAEYSSRTLWANCSYTIWSHGGAETLKVVYNICKC